MKHKILQLALVENIIVFLMKYNKKLKWIQHYLKIKKKYNSVAGL